MMQQGFEYSIALKGRNKSYSLFSIVSGETVEDVEKAGAAHLERLKKDVGKHRAVLTEVSHGDIRECSEADEVLWQSSKTNYTDLWC